MKQKNEEDEQEEERRQETKSEGDREERGREKEIKKRGAERCSGKDGGERVARRGGGKEGAPHTRPSRTRFTHSVRARRVRSRGSFTLSRSHSFFSFVLRLSRVQAENKRADVDLSLSLFSLS